MTTALAIQDLRKSFGSKEVLQGVSFAVDHGEIRALLGANGAGKSTLIGCLSGALQPDSGTIAVGAEVHEGFTPRGAFEAGIAVIYQHFSLVDPLTVADNVFLGEEVVAGGRLRRGAQEERTAQLLESLGATFSPRVEVSRLTAGERQLVEIAKVLRREPSVLILDEPTAALGEREARLLGERVQQLSRSRDIAVIYVSHLLPEVFALADSITVLRDGAVVLQEQMTQVRHDQVIAAISPSYEAETRERRVATGRETAVVSLRDVRTSFVGPLDVELRNGEVTALFGLMGSGRTETLETIMGIRQPASGSMQLYGAPHAPSSPAAAIAKGFALVPAERKERGVFAQLSSGENVLLPHISRLASAVARRRGSERKAFADVAARVQLRPPTPSTPCQSFSGGNQQKLVVGRWLVEGANVGVLLLDEPTQGIDIGARGDIYRLVRHTAATTDTLVVFASSDPEEVLLLADRVIVLHRGQVVLDESTHDLDERALLAAAHGTVHVIEEVA